MSKVFIEDTTLTAIGDAIRGKTGKEELINPLDMPEEIASLTTGAIVDGMIERTLTSIENHSAKSAGTATFANNTLLTSVKLYGVTSIGSQAFMGCSNLIEVELPKTTSVGVYSFQNCSKLIEVNLPEAISIGMDGFAICSKLQRLYVPKLQSIGNGAFRNCRSLKALIIEQTDKICSLLNAAVFTNCNHILGTVDTTYNPDGLKDGYIYVPDALVDSYKVATNWSQYASQIKPLSELEVTE